ncbi:hypothetical protein [Nocardia africana]|uniref:Predicted ATPase n=1 Tax=Nocardia africana TaxID=134964 RepID=A0A378X4Y2_9NOCA|nr:hypothetical protein [Nocardia africana]MCC3317886.1 hypothetical protein [Nocardia africana]SUA48660.1 Predicted ATPase [Nocardia africana]
MPDLLREWHADTTGFTIGLTSIGHRRVGRVDIDIMWSMGDALATADHHLGGGYARASLTAFLTGTVASALRGVYDTATASELHTVSARLANLAGFMHFDTARHRAAIGWFHTALALAKAGGNGALGAHILSDMAMQAHHQRRPADAVALAEAAVTTARHSGSPVTFARSSALLARAHALAGDRAAAARALTDAGRHLDRVIVDDEPAWVRFFNAEQLAAEIMYVAADSAQDTLVQRHAPLVLGSTGAMERRHVLASAALASAQLAGRAGDIDHAAQTLSDALPTASTVVSSRGLDAINAVRRQLARYPDRPSVLALENLYARTMVPVK